MKSRVMIFAIHRTSAWWRYVGDHLGSDECVVVSDVRGEGDICIVDDFYDGMREYRSGIAGCTELITPQVVDEVIQRCRVLRGMKYELARAMVYGMSAAMERLLERVEPTIIVSLPIDRYVTDVLQRRAAARGIPYVQIAASVFSGMTMLLDRGRLIKRDIILDAQTVENRRKELVSPSFLPTYVPSKGDFSTGRFLKTFVHFRTRSLVFQALALLRRDRLNFHYLEAHYALDYKNRIGDLRVLGLVQPDWRNRAERVERHQRVFFGLQLYPEASLDYWIVNRDLLDHDECVVEAATAFSAAGYTVLVKDHPLQFGFRRAELIERLLGLRNVMFIPYDVPAQLVLPVVGASFTFTGTLGLQAALAGMTSAVTTCYYTSNEDFILFQSKKDLSELPARVRTAQVPHSLEERQTRIVTHLLRGSFDGDLFSFRGFSGGSSSAVSLARALGATLHELSGRGRLVA